jgi:hypothetical protein
VGICTQAVFYLCGFAVVQQFIILDDGDKNSADAAAACSQVAVSIGASYPGGQQQPVQQCASR